MRLREPEVPTKPHELGKSLHRLLSDALFNYIRIFKCLILRLNNSSPFPFPHISSTPLSSKPSAQPPRGQGAPPTVLEKLLPPAETLGAIWAWTMRGSHDLEGQGCGVQRVDAGPHPQLCPQRAEGPMSQVRPWLETRDGFYWYHNCRLIIKPYKVAILCRKGPFLKKITLISRRSAVSCCMCISWRCSDCL